jgi:hypothetical protein
VSQELSIAIEASTIERTGAELVGVPLFADERPLRGSAGRADWRLCGKLSALILAGEISGEPGEAALVATFGGLRTPLLLVLGAGSREGYDARAYEQLAREATRRALALRVESLALSFAAEGAGAAAQERRASGLIAAAAASMSEAEDGRELQLRLLVPREESTRVTDLLRRARPGRLPEGVALRLPTTGPAAAAAAAQETPRGQQVVK